MNTINAMKSYINSLQPHMIPTFSPMLPSGEKPPGLIKAFLKSARITRQTIADKVIWLDGKDWTIMFEEDFNLSEESIAVIISYQEWSLNGTIRRYAIIRQQR